MGWSASCSGVRSSRAEIVPHQSNLADDLGSAVHHALETTRAIAVCPFHLGLTIRVGDDAAESHAFARARKLVKSDGTRWCCEVLQTEFGHQLRRAADRYGPHCALYAAKRPLS